MRPNLPSEIAGPQSEQPLGSKRRPFSGRNTLGGGFPQTLHDRSRAIGSELHKTLLAFCTAALGVYFIALTTEAKPGLTSSQRFAAVCGLVIMALGSLSGLAGMLADSRRNYFWACALQAEEGETERRAEMYRLRDRWWRI
jgi:hypothetical protein